MDQLQSSSMRVFLTGHKGKIGTSIHRLLLKEGHEIVGFDILDGNDILDANAVERAMADCDSVIHLATLLGHDQPNDLKLTSGVIGTWYVLQAAEKHQVRRVVYYSSVNAMGLFQGEDKPDFLPIDETHPCRPGRAYGTSKYLSEHTCRLFTQRTGIATVCFRPPAVWTEKDIQHIKEARAQKPEFEWTPFWEYGCFIHVEDLAHATLCALTCPDPGHIPLLVTADDITSAALTSRELVDKLLPEVEWRGGPEYDADPYRSLVDCQRAQDILGWSPRYRWRP